MSCGVCIYTMLIGLVLLNPTGSPFFGTNGLVRAEFQCLRVGNNDGSLSHAIPCISLHLGDFTRRDSKTNEGIIILVIHATEIK